MSEVYGGELAMRDIQMLRRLALIGEAAMADGYQPESFDEEIVGTPDEAIARLKSLGTEFLRARGGSSAFN